MKNIAIERACAIVGSQAALARAINVHPTMPYQWINGYCTVPVARCPDIERVTRGAVTCEELRSDVDWGYLRGTDKDRRDD